MDIFLCDNIVSSVYHLLLVRTSSPRHQVGSSISRKDYYILHASSIVRKEKYHLHDVPRFPCDHGSRFVQSSWKHLSPHVPAKSFSLDPPRLLLPPHAPMALLTPFLDTYLWTRIWELMRCRSAGERVVTDYQRSCRWVMMPMTRQQNMAKSRDDG